MRSEREEESSDIIYLDPTDPITLKAHSHILLPWIHRCIEENISCITPKMSEKIENKNLEYQLTHPILIETNQEDNKIRMRVMDQPMYSLVGDGAFGTVHRILGSLKENQSHQLIYTPGVRIGKIICSIKPELLDAEFALLQRVHSLKAKSLMQFDEYNGIMIMHHGGERDASRMIKKDVEDLRNKKNHIPAKKRYALTLAILRALQLVHLHHIIHRDVKPANFIPNDKNPYLDSHCIDFGLSKDDADETVTFCGSFAYLSLEAQYPINHTAAQEMFSLGMAIAELWRVPNVCDEYDLSSKSDIPRLIRILKTYKIKKIFAGIHDLTPEEKIKIHETLNRMLSVNPSERPPLDEVLRIFEKLYLKHEPTWLEETYEFANAIRENLDHIHYEKLPGYTIVPEDVEDLLGKVETCIADRAALLPDNHAMACFKFYTGVGYFAHAKTHADLVKSVRRLKASYVTQHDELLALLKKIALSLARNKTPELGALFTEVDAITRRRVKAFTVDNIAYLDQKFSKYLPIFRDRFHAISAQYAAESASPSGTAGALFAQPKQGDTAASQTYKYM